MTQAVAPTGIRPLLWLAAGCAVILAAVLAVELGEAATRETRLSIGSTARPDAAALARTPPAAAIDAVAAAASIQDWTRIALARPIFSPSRRPTAVAASGPQQPRLAGIVLGPAGARAIFAGAGDDRGIVAGVGQQAGDWRVLSIAADSVEVGGPAGTRTLRPTRDTAAHDDDAATNASLSAHPSILDLLRSRPMRIGAPDNPMPPLPFALPNPQSP